MNSLQRKFTIFFICIAPIIGYSQFKLIKTFDDASGEITAMRVSSDTKYLAAGNKLGIITLWDYESGKEIFKVRNHKSEVNFIFFHPTSHELVAADENEIMFYDMSTGDIKSRISIFEKIDWMDVSPVNDVLFLLASVKNRENSEEVYKVDLNSRRFDAFYSSSGISAFKVSPDGKQLFMTKGSDMDFLNIGLQIVEKEFDDHLSKIKTIDINPADPLWMVTSDHSVVRYWQTTTGKNIPFNWSVRNAFIIQDSKILTANADSLILRDYKVLHGEKFIKIEKDGIKDVMVDDSRNTIFVLTNTNKIEVYPTEINAPLMSAPIVKAASPTQKIATLSTNVAAKIDVEEEYKMIYAKYKNQIEAEIALKAELFAPRGEFEKSTSYEGRQAEAKSYRDGIFRYYNDKHTRAQELDKQLALTKQRYLDSLSRRDEERKLSLYREKIKDSYKEFSTKIESIGTYRADHEEFPITIDGVTHNVKVPIDNARSFKTNYKSMKVVGVRQLLDDAVTSETFNIKVVDIRTNSVYDFGKQKAPLYVLGKEKNGLLVSMLAANTRSNTPVAASTEEKVVVTTKGNLEKQIGDYLAKKKYYALLIGVNDYQDPTINSLDNPLNDALRLKRVLNETYTFDEENITVLRNPTRTGAFQIVAESLNCMNN